MDSQVMFSLTIYRNGQVSLTTANGQHTTPLVVATLRDVATALEEGALVLREEG